MLLPQLAECPVAELPDSLAGHTHHPSDLLQGAALPVVETEVEPEHLGVPGRKRRQRPPRAERPALVGWRPSLSRARRPGSSDRSTSSYRGTAVRPESLEPPPLDAPLGETDPPPDDPPDEDEPDDDDPDDDEDDPLLDGADEPDEVEAVRTVCVFAVATGSRGAMRV